MDEERNNMAIIGEDKIVSIDLVRPNTWNPKEGIEDNEINKAHYEEIKKQISDKGLFEAITVRELGDKYEILDGFHRWTACKELGFTEIRINNLGIINDQLARAITLIKEQKKVPISEVKVAEVVNWFKEQDMADDTIKELLGYSDETYKEYSELFEFDWEQYNTEDTDIGETPDKEVECPNCGHKFIP